MNEKSLDNKCPSCSATLLFNPKLGKWKCDYCDSTFTLEELKKYNNASSVSNSKDNQKDNTKYVNYTCKDCGAEIIADEQTAATFCVYCGNTAILKSKLDGEFAPDKIIPFKKIKDDAINAFKGLSKGRIYMPKTFNDIKNIEKIRGIYIPFWLYDINVAGSVVADAKTIKSWIVGDRHYTKTDIYKLYRTGSMDYLKVPTDGSTRFENDIMQTIEPFNYNEMVDYNHAYLSGFLAEKYDVKSEEAFKESASRAINSATENVKMDMSGYTSKTITENNLVATQKKVQYAMLPVYMVNVKYKEKYYLFAMNGQTGEFVGNIPLDKPKIIRVSLLVFVIVFLIVMLVSYIMFVIGVK